MKIIRILFIALLVASCTTQAQVPPVNDQIVAASLAVPEEYRAEVTVLGYTSAGRIEVLKEGTNHLVCLADNPSNEGFSVACYHKDLDPYMARGRELREQGIGGQENLAKRQEEVEAGTLSWTSSQAVLYVLSGDDDAFDAESGTAESARLRYVIYVPYATAESTGLSALPTAPGAPWLMDGGTYRAHIMISPPAVN